MQGGGVFLRPPPYAFQLTDAFCFRLFLYIFL